MGSPSARCVLIRRLPSKLIRSASGSSQTSKQVDSWQEFSSSLAQAPSLLPASLSLSLSHGERRREGGREAGALSLSPSLGDVCVCVCVRMTHSVSYTRLLLDTSLFLQGERENYCLKLEPLRTSVPGLRTHARVRAHTHTLKNIYICRCAHALNTASLLFPPLNCHCFRMCKASEREKKRKRKAVMFFK